MKTNFEMVREFHRAFECPNANAPQHIPPQRRDLRVDLIREEFEELRQAINGEDMVGIADALADLLYVVYGTGHEYGIQLDAAFAEVHRSNMTKLGADGKPERRSDGKVMKGPNWQKPDLQQVLRYANQPRKGLVYLASPYSHAEASVREQRFVDVSRAAAKLMRDGVFVYSPIAHTHPIAVHGDMNFEFEFWEAYDRHILDLCDEVVVLTLDGWHVSKGVQAELAIAQELRLPVSYMDPV